MKTKTDTFKFPFPFSFNYPLQEPIYIAKRPNGVYAAQIGPKGHRTSLHTTDRKIAEKRVEALKSAARTLAAHERLPQMAGQTKATKTPLAKTLDDYVIHCKAVKKATTVSADIFYLRDTFGEACASLKKVPRKKDDEAKAKDSPHTRRLRKQMRDPDGRIEVEHIEDLTKSMVLNFISNRVRTRSLKPKSANRYRDTLLAFANWAIEYKEVQFPEGNPIEAVKKYKEGQPEITYLTLEHIKEQLDALANKPELQTQSRSTSTPVFAARKRCGLPPPMWT